MFQDDRVMSILTGLVIVVAMAVLAQRSESIATFFTRDEAARIAPQNDAVAVFAGESRIIDVLANDENATPEDGANLRIIVSPSCGAAEATANGILYVANDRCVGPQLFAYCVARGDECASASVTVAVAAAPAVAPGASQTPRVASGQVPQEPAAPTSDTRVNAGADTQTAARTDTGAGPTSPAPFQPQIAETSAAPEPVIAAINPVAPIQPVAPRAADQLGLLPTVDSSSGLGSPSPLAPQPSSPVVRDTNAETGVVIDGASQPFTGVPASPPIQNITSAPAAPAPVSTQIASLSDPEERAVNDRVRDEAVDQIRQAALTFPQTGAGAGCGVAQVKSVAVSGGASRVTVNSPCRAGEPVEVEHAGLRFGGTFDLAGNAEIVIPVMDGNQDAAVILDDGNREPVDLAFNWREIELTLRVAVTWSAPIDLNLHAFEYAASYGAEGHVWQEQPRGFRMVRQAGGGFLSNFPATKADGESVEVYTFWANSRARRGTARIALEHASRGDLPDGAFCDGGALASPSYKVVQAERGKIVSTRRGRFAPARCGQELAADLRYVSGALRDLQIE